MSSVILRALAELQRASGLGDHESLDPLLAAGRSVLPSSARLAALQLDRRGRVMAVSGDARAARAAGDWLAALAKRASDRPLLVLDATGTPEDASSLAALGLSSLAWAPIARPGAAAFGALVAETEAGQPALRESELGELPLLCDAAASALAVGAGDPDGVLPAWRALDVLASPADLEGLLADTLHALLERTGAQRVSIWRATDGAWTPRQTVSRENEAETSVKEAPLVESAAKSGEAHAQSDGQLLFALSCASTAEAVAVLTFAIQGASDPETALPLPELRALAGRIGRGLKSVDLLEGVGRTYQHAQERLRKEAIELRNLLRKREGLLGSDEKMREVMKAIERTARTNLPVLLSGETGTGKEAAARLIHRVSGRSGPFVVVDCGAIPQQLLESELFGYERGAFTGAEGRRIGRFEEAHRGTLFLDELGELPVLLQPKLLRVLQESTLRRIGGDREVELDLRVIAATNRDLPAMVARGGFREDLYFRLSVMEISMPPLRERGEDVLLLTIYFLRQYCAEVGRELMSISPEAQAVLLAHSWQGNVRELQNRVRRAVVMASGHELTAHDLQLPQNGAEAPAQARKAKPRSRSFSAAPPPSPPPPAPSSPSLPSAVSLTPVTEPEKLDLTEAVADWFWQSWSTSAPDAPPPQDCIEAFLLRAALQSSDGSLRRAAALLQMHVDTFGTHLERLGHPALSRTVRAHRLSKVLEHSLAEGPTSGESLIDRTLAVVLRELLVYCHGNKSEMARILGWGRRTLWRHFRKLGISSAEMA